MKNLFQSAIVMITILLLPASICSQTTNVNSDLKTWPKGSSPREIGKRVAEHFIASPHFNSFLKKHGLNKSDVLFMGDDIPDYGVMKEAGIAVCPSDADSEIKQVAAYISDKKGGEGCVRDVIEQVLRLHNNWMDSDAFTW